MKISRLRVAELRQFLEPFELTQIQPGLNIFCGANEAGKSTLVRAIRAAFFERYRSTSVEDLRPAGHSAAAPTVEVDFEIAGKPCRLLKTFLHKKRCELQLGTQKLESIEAEDALAELLGFQFAARGASREENWGIPGLLWVEQGSAQQLQGAVSHASEHLRKALDASLGEVAASGGDEVVDQVMKLRDELLTPTTGKARGAYQKAIEEAQTLQQREQELQQAVAQYRNQVDQLKVWREAHAADAQQQPWVAWRAQQAQAQHALQVAQALLGQRDRLHEALRRESGLQALLTQGLQAAEAEEKKLHQRQADLQAAKIQLEQCTQAQTQREAAEAQADSQLKTAQAALYLAQQEDTRQALRQQLDQAQSRAKELAATLHQARAQHEQAQRLLQEAAALHVDPKALALLRQQHSQLHTLQVEQSTIATRLRFELEPGAQLQLDGQVIHDQGERLLVAAATLHIPGAGKIIIRPGGKDLASLGRAQAQLQQAHHSLLQRLDLADLAAAEARHQSHSQRVGDAESAKKACQLLAPEGLDVLQQALSSAQSRQHEAESVLAKLPPAGAAVSEPSNAPPALTLHSAQRQLGSALQAQQAASAQLHSARQALAAAGSAHQAASRELQALKTSIEEPTRQTALQQRQAELVQTTARVATLKQEAQGIDKQIAEQRLDILEQDALRLRRSAEQAEQQHQALALQLVQLQSTLAAAGARGLEEDLARTQGASGQAQRRLEELRRRAEALDLLTQLLSQKRQALIHRLQAPLQKHLDHYLPLLFPAGRLSVDEKLQPLSLSRPGQHGHAAASDFEALSFGAREQMGVISRLAYADLLQAAGRPTLIILDDALVHSDSQRLAQMKRVLFDAAQRHQVLLFSCHPEVWRDMGVPLQDLQALRALQAAGKT